MTFKHMRTDLMMKTVNTVHGTLIKVSGGRLGGTAGGMTTVELHSVGRKSGRARNNLLTAPIIDNDRIILVASKGGDERHPDWYHNITAQPNVEVTIGGVREAVTARTASADEKAEMWSKITAEYKGYARYQEKTDREIPVVICDRC